MLDVDDEVGIPRTGLGDRRTYTCNINAFRLTAQHTKGTAVERVKTLQDGFSYEEEYFKIIQHAGNVFL